MARDASAPVCLSITNLTQEFVMGEQPVHALRGISVEVREGEFIAVMGPSGSGKSTLLNLVGGLDRPTGGSIRVDGRDLVDLDENELAAYRRKTVGFVFQSYNLIPSMTALENVEMPLVFSGVSPRKRQSRARAALTEVGLQDRLSHRPPELSGGEQQRVALARALINQPRMVLADEPTGNLDTKTGAEVLGMFRRLNRERGLTLIVVTHDAEVSGWADRTIRLRDGSIEDNGSD